MNKLITEFIGTFFLVLTIGMAVNSGQPMAPLAIGSILMTMIYMGGHVSGAHYNPAVSLAVMLRGKLSGGEFLQYVGAQLAGALLAALAIFIIDGKTFDGPAPTPGMGTGSILLVEFLYTFALALVVLNVATSQKTAGNSFYGLAIGFTVLAGAFAAGARSGGAFNPAVGTGPIIVNALLGDGSLGNLWLYLVGPFAGGAAAAVAFASQDGP